MPQISKMKIWGILVRNIQFSPMAYSNMTAESSVYGFTELWTLFNASQGLSDRFISITLLHLEGKQNYDLLWFLLSFFFLTFSNQVCWDGFRRLTGNEFLIKFPISKSEVVPGDDFGRLKYTCSWYPSTSCTSLTPKKYTNWIKPPLPQPIRLLSLSFFYIRSKDLPCAKSRVYFIN